MKNVGQAYELGGSCYQPELVWLIRWVFFLVDHPIHTASCLQVYMCWDRRFSVENPVLFRKVRCYLFGEKYSN